MSFKRVLAGVGALGLMGAVSVALAAPSSAGVGQETEQPDEVQLDATLSPTVVAPGETVTVSSVEPCPDTYEASLYWEFGSQDDPSIGWEGDDFSISEDGSWTKTFEAPTEASWGDEEFSPIGDYYFYAACPLPEACYDTPEAATSVTEEPDCTDYFYEETFTVEEASTPPTTAPPGTTPPPAKPIVDDPPFTG